MKRLLLFILFSGTSCYTLAQCAQTLRLVRATYEQGRLNEIEAQLKSCLEPAEKGGFTKQENQLRVEALKILTMSYIYLEEPQKADAAMLSLKKADPYYRPNSEVDPAEFVALYNSYREEPVYRYGVRLGVNYSRPNIMELVSVVELADESKFKALPDFQFGAAMDLPIMLFKQKNKWTLHGEVLYQMKKYEISIRENRSNDPDNPLLNEFIGTESQTSIGIPITLEYRLLANKLNPYLALGASPDFILNSTLFGELKREDERGVEERTLDVERKNINISALAALGIKVSSGPGLIVFEIRYAHGLTNLSSPETAFANQSLALDYGYADSIFKLSSLSFAGSYIFNKHNPKKLTRKK
ncbi:MAG: PorT family protein [Cyclobacteriaceae bacterium]|nr:PorT family protein [Cyclobacteriaceae bacterium]